MLRHLFRILLASVLLATCCLAGSAPTLTASAALPPLDISELTSFLATLAPDEQDEQLRDWAVFGLKSAYAAPASEELPIRHPAMEETRPREVSPGRVFPLSPQEWGVLVPREQLGNKPLIGGLVDDRHAAANLLPQRISLFGYAYDAAAATIAITAAGSVDTDMLFTPAYGYHAATVGTPEDFARFTRQIDDLVAVRWRADGLHLGGRKYVSGDRRSVTVEEIAALYQAYQEPAGTDGSKREVSIGFSLDPQRDYQALAADLEKLPVRFADSVATDQRTLTTLVASRSKELAAVAASLRTRRDLRPFLALRNRYQFSADPTDQLFGELLRYTDVQHTYQAARYDGRIQGTRAAMILFYTDLLAKLWAIDYEGATPGGAVKGLRTMQEITVPRLYWDEMEQLAQTRLWFGPRPDGFELYGDTMLFRPVATRVYAASFDPRTPGRESPPNFQSREFLGWWDTHYDAVAEYEPYFHKLNQLQKWSSVFVVLKEKQSHLLDYLSAVPVARTLDFATWSRNNPALRGKIDIPFLDSRTFGRTTECIPLLVSKEYRLMGANYSLSGGVSLASRKDVQAKLRRQAAAAPAPVTRSSREIPVAERSGRLAGRTPAAPAASAVAGAGTFRAEKQQRSINLKWEKGPSVVLSDFVAALAARQRSNLRSSRGEGVFGGVPEIQSVVRVKEGATYLVKSAALRDAWIYLSINPARVSDYPARAAADLREADVFCARLITSAEASRLAAGKAVLK